MNFYQETLARLKKHAELDHPYPQYKGHFDSFKLALIRKSVTGFKGGSNFHKGDFVLAKMMNRPGDSFDGYYEVYCTITGHICVVKPECITTHVDRPECITTHVD